MMLDDDDDDDDRDRIAQCSVQLANPVFAGCGNQEIDHNMLRYPEGLKSATPSELYIKIRNNMKLDLHIIMRD